MRFCFLFFSIISCLLSSFSYSQDTLNPGFSKIPDYPGKNKRYVGFRIYHENDFLALFFNNTDDNYTGGSKLEIITNLFNDNKIALLNPFLNPLNGDFSSLSILFGYTAYTPQELKDSLVIYNDRPYASYRFWGLGISSVSSNMKWKLYYELQLGELGKPLAGDIQIYAHDNLRHCCGFTRDIPRGWDFQVGFPGSFALNLNAKLERRIWQSNTLGKKENFRWAQFSARSELNYGRYMTNISVAPHISLANWNHNFGDEDEPGIPSIDVNPVRNEVTEAVANCKTGNKAGFHLFIGIRPKYVIHNSTLTGKRLKKASIHTISSSELDRFFMEYNFGFSFKWAFFRLGYNLFIRGREFSFQNKDCQTWGGLHIGGIFRFE